MPKGPQREGERDHAENQQKLGVHRVRPLLMESPEQRLWIYLVLLEESFQLLRAEIREHELAHHERGGVALAGEINHLLIQAAIRFDIDELVFIPAAIE